MIYFRWTYDFEYGDAARDHPVIEVVKDKTTVDDLRNIHEQLENIIMPSILSITDVRIKRK